MWGPGICQASETDGTCLMRKKLCKTQCFTKLTSPNRLFLGILPLSIFIWALFNCLIVILNLFSFNLPSASRNVNLALEDHLTKESFSERLTSRSFSPGCEKCRLQLCQFQPAPGRCSSARGGGAWLFPCHQQLALLRVPSPPCTDRFSA